MSYGIVGFRVSSYGEYSGGDSHSYGGDSYPSGDNYFNTFTDSTRDSYGKLLRKVYQKTMLLSIVMIKGTSSFYCRNYMIKEASSCYWRNYVIKGASSCYWCNYVIKGASSCYWHNYMIKGASLSIIINMASKLTGGPSDDHTHLSVVYYYC